jgi:hypothetical protein
MKKKMLLERGTSTEISFFISKIKVPFAIHFEDSRVAPTIASGTIEAYFPGRVVVAGFCVVVTPVADTTSCRKFVIELPK